jgi:hypothetical protein
MKAVNRDPLGVIKGRVGTAVVDFGLENKLGNH